MKSQTSNQLWRKKTAVFAHSIRMKINAVRSHIRMLYMSIKYARRTVRIYAYAYVHNHIRITCMLYADSTLRLSRVRACVLIRT